MSPHKTHPRAVHIVLQSQFEPTQSQWERHRHRPEMRADQESLPSLHDGQTLFDLSNDLLAALPKQLECTGNEVARQQNPHKGYSYRDL